MQIAPEVVYLLFLQAPFPHICLCTMLLEASQKESDIFKVSVLLSMPPFFLSHRKGKSVLVRYLPHVSTTWTSLGSFHSNSAQFVKYLSLVTILLPKNHHSPHMWCNLIMC